MRHVGFWLAARIRGIEEYRSFEHADPAKFEMLDTMLLKTLKLSRDIRASRSLDPWHLPLLDAIGSALDVAV